MVKEGYVAFGGKNCLPFVRFVILFLRTALSCCTVGFHSSTICANIWRFCNTLQHRKHFLCQYDCRFSRRAKHFFDTFTKSHKITLDSIERFILDSIQNFTTHGAFFLRIMDRKLDSGQTPFFMNNGQTPCQIKLQQWMETVKPLIALSTNRGKKYKACNLYTLLQAVLPQICMQSVARKVHLKVLSLSQSFLESQAWRQALIA